ncbi:MAG: hypothetical protein D6731_13605 [Planctomycetota bacterium]|nr:MAG: hypothetical protein D6731_13605 [Planctomycetota bacterium]
MASIEPLCLALVLCDTVIEDVRTRNKSLVNMFNGILSPAVPVRHDKLCAFAAFTGGRGEVPISLRLCYDKEYERDLLTLGGLVRFPADNPHAVVDIVFEIRGFVFPRFGAYTFELSCKGRPLMTRRFAVTQTRDDAPHGN